MIFIIDNHYAGNHEENCIIVKNDNLTIEEMIDLIGSIGNYYLRCTGRNSCQPRKLLNILCNKFESTNKYETYIHQMDFIERRLYSPMLHTAFVMRGKIVIWIDMEESMNYAMSRMWVVLNEYFVEDELLQVKKEWMEEVIPLVQ